MVLLRIVKDEVSAVLFHRIPRQPIGKDCEYFRNVSADFELFTGQVCHLRRSKNSSVEVSGCGANARDFSFIEPKSRAFAPQPDTSTDEFLLRRKWQT